MNIPIEGIEGKVSGKTLVISSIIPLKILSSAVVGGGFSTSRFILNHHVDLNYNHDNPGGDLQNVADKLDIKENFTGMMTAVDMENAAVETKGPVTVVVTGGVTNAIASGEKTTIKNGTINTILLIDANLKDAAMVNAVINTTEAKTFALRDLKIKSKRSDEIATGTSTDTIVVACTGKGDEIKYAGAATVLGERIGRATRKAVKGAIKRQEKL